MRKILMNLAKEMGFELLVVGATGSLVAVQQANKAWKATTGARHHLQIMVAEAAPQLGRVGLGLVIGASEILQPIGRTTIKIRRWLASR